MSETPESSKGTDAPVSQEPSAPAKPNGPLGLVLVGLAGCAETAAAAKLVGLTLPLASTLPWWVWHCLGVAMSSAGFSLWFPPGLGLGRRAMNLLIVGFTAAAPLAGWLFLVAFRLFFKLPAAERLESRFILGDRLVVTSVRVSAASARQHRSVLEILNGRDNTLRRKAILALRAVDQRRALPVLQKAIQDGDDQVRLLAQTQYNKILAGIELSVKSLEAEIQKGNPSVVRLLQLAEQYHELVFLGLSSEETQVIYLGRAMELLEIALQKQPDHLGVRLLMLKCLVRSRKLDAASEQLIELRKLGMREEILLPWEADIRFQRRDWTSLKECLIRMKSGRLKDSRLGAPIDFWLGEDDPPSTASQKGGTPLPAPA